MMKINSKQCHALMISGFALLCLSACQSTPKGSVVEPKPASARNVVLLDPKVDDAMLPAIGEGLSKGQVTIYPLDGALATSASGISVGNAVTMGASAPVAIAPQNKIQLVPPANMTGQNGDSRITTYSLDTGAPVVATQVVPTIERPKLQAPVSAKSSKLESPFNADGVPVAKPVTKKRPPKGMTY